MEYTMDNIWSINLFYTRVTIHMKYLLANIRCIWLGALWHLTRQQEALYIYKFRDSWHTTKEQQVSELYTVYTTNNLYVYESHIPWKCMYFLFCTCYCCIYQLGKLFIPFWSDCEIRVRLKYAKFAFIFSTK